MMSEYNITEYIKDKYKPEAIVLFGSRAYGKHTIKSDWDIIIISKDNKKVEPEILNGEELDIDVVSMPVTTEKLIEDFGGTLQNTKILFDTNSIAKELLSKLYKYYEKGRNLSEKEKQNRLNFLRRRLNKLEGSVNNDGVFFFHLGIFYEKAIQYWFELKENKWSFHPREALIKIKEADPEYYKKMSILFDSNSSNKQKLDSSLFIYNKIFSV